MVQITNKKRIDNYSILIFSFFLAFGLYDPFGTGGVYFDAITIFVMVVIYINANKRVLFHRELRNQYLLLLSIALLFFFSSVFYKISHTGAVPIDFKYISAITIFWFFSYKFNDSKKLRDKCLLVFALASGIIAFGYKAGFFDGQFEFRNDRLLIFEENPNSISSRMAIGFIILLYHIIQNPLKLGKKRFFLAVFLLPLLLFVIDTGSRGSFVILLIASVLLVLISNIKIGIKIGLGILLLISGSYFLVILQNTGLWDRFNADDISGGRELIWSNVLEIIQNHPFGVGQEGYKIEMMKLLYTAKDPHNLFLYILVCGGWIALTLFFVFLWSLLKKAYLQFKQQNVLPMLLFIFLIFLMNKTGGIITYLIMWYFLAYINSYSLDFKQKSH